MPKFTYPGTKYLGPGNPYPNGPPTSSADRIAQKHDKSYIDAKSTNDILKSDWNSTKEFASDFVKHPNIQSAVGAVGLGAKTGIERVVGVQYPNMKRGSTGEGSNFKKHQSQSITQSDIMDTDPSSSDTIDATAATAAAGGGGGAGGAGVSRSEDIFTGIPQKPNYHSVTLTKTYHFFCKNDLPKYRKLTPQGQYNTALEYSYIQAPPVDRLRFYMSPREEALYREQYTEVNCENVSVDVISLGARGQFSTGGTTATNANMQLQAAICEMKGIDKDFPTFVEEAKITALLGKLEGSNPYDVVNAEDYTAAIPDFPARCGSRKMDCPLRVIYPNPKSYANNGTEESFAVQNKLNWPNTYQYLKMKNGAILAQNSPTFSYNYTPKNKYLFGRNNFTRAEAYIQDSAAVQPNTLMQNNAEYIMRTQHTQNNIKSGTTGAELGQYVNAINLQPKDIRIENQYQHNGTEMFKPHRMPRFMFGVMPLRNATDDSNQEIQWEFLMVCTINLRCKSGAPGMYGHTMDFPEPMYMYPTQQKGNYGNYGAVAEDADTGTQIIGFNERRNVFGRPTITIGTTTNIPQGTGSTTNGITPSVITRSRSKRIADESVSKNVIKKSKA